MSKLYELIDNEIRRRNTSKQEMLDYITEKYISRYDELITSESKFISEIVLEKIIEYRKEHPDTKYNKTLGLTMHKYVYDVVVEIKDIKSSFFKNILFFFFKKYMIK